MASGPQQLERDALGEAAVGAFGQIDFAHPAAADQPPDPERPDRRPRGQRTIARIDRFGGHQWFVEQPDRAVRGQHRAHLPADIIARFERQQSGFLLRRGNIQQPIEQHVDAGPFGGCGMAHRGKPHTADTTLHCD
jgi:hypothetical protein